MSDGVAGPCDWDVDLGCCTDVFALASPSVTGGIVDSAVAAAWAAGGRQHGLCSATLRPCRRDCGDGRSGDWLYADSAWPFPGGSNWLALSCGGCIGTCSCSSVSEVVLPGPVEEVTKVTVDGVDLGTDAYRLDAGRLLVRQDGFHWPVCQDLSLPAGTVGTWTVEPLYGRPVPSLGKLAAGELACELMKACQGSECRIPTRYLQTVTRQGVTEVYVDPLALTAAGRLGLEFFDLYVDTYNPHRLSSPPTVMSPDGPRWR